MLYGMAWVVVLSGLGACSRASDAGGPGSSEAAAPAAAVVASAAPKVPAAPAFGSGTPPQTGRPPKPPEDPCVALCERSRELKCRASASCAARCANMRRESSCQREMSAALACFAREPKDHFECDDSGVASIREGYCEAEQAGVAACLERTLSTSGR